MKRLPVSGSMAGFYNGFVALAILLLCGAVFFTKSATAQGSANQVPVLDGSSSFWRVYYVISAPVIRNGKEIKKLSSITEDTPPPPKDWTKADFDDSPWTRIAGRPLLAKMTSDVSKASFDAGSAETEGRADSRCGELHALALRACFLPEESGSRRVCCCSAMASVALEKS